MALNVAVFQLLTMPLYLHHLFLRPIYNKAQVKSFRGRTDGFLYLGPCEVLASPVEQGDLPKRFVQWVEIAVRISGDWPLRTRSLFMRFPNTPIHGTCFACDNVKMNSARFLHFSDIDSQKCSPACPLLEIAPCGQGLNPERLTN